MTDRGGTARRRLKDVDHTHPDHDTTAGRLFTRGPAVIADGGRPDAGEEGDTPETRLKDIDHEGPDGEGPNRVWERGKTPRPSEADEE